MRIILGCKKCKEPCKAAEDAVAVICWRCTMKMCIAEEMAQKSRRVDIGGLQEAIRRGKLRRFRKENGRSQDELARILRISRRYLRDIENGKRMPSEKWIENLGKTKIR